MKLPTWKRATVPLIYMRQKEASHIHKPLVPSVSSLVEKMMESRVDLMSEGEGERGLKVCTQDHWPVINEVMSVRLMKYLLSHIHFSIRNTHAGVPLG